MSLDGLRAWIGVVERKLTMRTRVFLVLVAFAIGGATVGIVLAVDVQNSAVSKDDLQTVRDEVAGAGTPAGASNVTELEAELEALRSEVAALRGTGETEANPDPEEAPDGEDATGGAAVPEGRKELEEKFERFKEEPSK